MRKRARSPSKDRDTGYVVKIGVLFLQEYILLSRSIYLPGQSATRSIFIPVYPYYMFRTCICCHRFNRMKTQFYNLTIYNFVAVYIRTQMDTKEGRKGNPNIFCSRLTTHARTYVCLLYTSPSPRDRQKSRMPSSA